MRICILTQPLGANYGGILQAYALQKVLRDMGHDVTTLRFRPATPWVPTGVRKHLLTLRRFISKYLKGNRDIVCCDPARQTCFAYQELDRFIEEHLRCQEVQAPLSAAAICGFDAFVVGSDQVWRPAYSPCLPNFYLDFLGDAPVKRIAYAASFGVDKWETDEQTTALIRPLAQRFDAVSVREASAVELCRKHLGVDARLMPDPTLLLQAADYRALCGTQQGPSEDYIAEYLLDKGEREQRFIDRLSAQTGLPVRQIGQLDWARSTDSLESWIAAIAGARYVVTNSFHGTVFSLLFERSFFAIINQARGASRFVSLLDAAGLRERLIDGSELQSYSPDLKDIDFKPVSQKIAALRQAGLQFLSTI